MRKRTHHVRKGHPITTFTFYSERLAAFGTPGK